MTKNAVTARQIEVVILDVVCKRQALHHLDRFVHCQSYPVSYDRWYYDASRSLRIFDSAHAFGVMLAISQLVIAGSRVSTSFI